MPSAKGRGVPAAADRTRGLVLAAGAGHALAEQEGEFAETGKNRPLPAGRGRFCMQCSLQRRSVGQIVHIFNKPGNRKLYSIFPTNH